MRKTSLCHNCRYRQVAHVFLPAIFQCKSSPSTTTQSTPNSKTFLDPKKKQQQHRTRLVVPQLPILLCSTFHFTTCRIDLKEKSYYMSLNVSRQTYKHYLCQTDRISPDNHQLAIRFNGNGVDIYVIGNDDHHQQFFNDDFWREFLINTRPIITFHIIYIVTVAFRYIVCSLSILKNV